MRKAAAGGGSRDLAIVVAAALALQAPAAGTALAWRSGPPADHVGLCEARQSCATSMCHDSFPVNAGTSLSTLELEAGGAPMSYSPGEVMRLVVEATTPTAPGNVFGFQLAAVAGCPLPSQAGTLGILDAARTRVVTSGGGLDFIEHTNAGVSLPASASWLFEWLAPAEPVGEVTFYWATNDANNNSTPTGDRIKLWQLTVTPDCPGRIEPLSAVKQACDPAEPGVLKVAASWPPDAWAAGYRVYTTDDAPTLTDPVALGAAVAGETAAPTWCGEPARYFTVVGLCGDGSAGPD